jgi:hypothetical protein
MREARLPAQQPIYRVRQFVFCLVERAFGCYLIILAHLVGCENGFLRCDPLPGSIKDCGFGIFHEPILAALNIGVGAVSDCLVPFAPEYRRERRWCTDAGEPTVPSYSVRETPARNFAKMCAEVPGCLFFGTR